MKNSRASRVHYLEPLFSGTACIAGFTTRHEGLSRPPYNSLNLGLNTQDAPHNLEGNRSILARAFGADIDRLVTVRQAHGTDILVIDEPNEDISHFLGIESDAIITNQPDLMIGVCVADCAPILLHDPVRRISAAVHAGWQGTAANISGKAVSAMKKLFDCREEDIRCAVGPCIKKCCYEVDEPVKNAFSSSALEWDEIASPSETGKWRLEIGPANVMQLAESGIPPANIESADICVSCHKELFFSYRRDRGETGRQIGFIMLKGR